ncbi:MAG: alpha/beta hydrolase [Pseudomonas sp.]|nr:alpha/beta hydrolase [Pseudomonas sp.]
MPRFARLMLLPLALLGTACSPLAPVNFLVTDDTYRLVPDQPYGDAERQKLDVYLPLTDLAEAPVVVFFYGGTWRNGNRADYAFVGEALASRGIITVIPDYRVYPEVTYPAFLEDSAAATVWVKQQQASWQSQPQPVFLMGHSSGAYNAAMLAMDERWLGEHGLSPENLAGWIGLSGPYEFLPIINPDVKPIFPYPDTPQETQPFFHADADSPPALLLAATPDKLVDPERNTGQLTEKLRRAGVEVETHYYPSLHHLTIIVVMADPLEWWEPVAEQVHDFVRRYSSGSSASAP